MVSQLCILRRAPHVLCMSANEFIGHLIQFAANTETVFPLADIQVIGKVKLPKITFSKPLNLERIYFTEAVYAGNCEFLGSLHLSSCAFDKGLDLSQVNINFGITFHQCEFGLHELTFQQVALNLTRATISGDVTFLSTIVHGCLSGRGITVKGDIAFTACTVKGRSSLTGALVDFSISEIAGDIIFEANKADLTSELSPSALLLKINSKRFDVWSYRSIFIDDDNNKSINLWGAKVVNLISLSYARFQGSVGLVSVSCRSLWSGGGYFRCRPDEPVEWEDNGINDGIGTAEIIGNLELSASNIDWIQLHGITITRSVICVAGKSGQIQFDDWIEEFNDTIFIIPAQAGGFTMTAWECHDHINCNFSRVGGAINHWNINGIEITSSQITKSLTFWPGGKIERIIERYIRFRSSTPLNIFVRDFGEKKLTRVDQGDQLRHFLNRWRRQQLIEGKLHIERCTIRGDLNLTGVNIADKTQKGAGRLNVIDTRVDGRVMFFSPISYLCDPRYDGPLLQLLAQYFVADRFTGYSVPTPIKQKRPVITELSVMAKKSVTKLSQRLFKAKTTEPVYKSSMPIETAVCDAVDMRGLIATDIDLTGLRIRNPEDPPKIREARVDLDYAQIHHELSVFVRLDGRDAKSAYNVIRRIISPPDVNTSQQFLASPVQNTFEDNQKRMLALCLGEEAIGDLLSRLPMPLKEAVEMHAVIPGALDLQHADIGEARLSDASFCDSALSESALDAGIVLDFARIRKLRIARGAIKPQGNESNNGFPMPVSLLDLKVDAWFLEMAYAKGRNRRSNDHETIKADPYLDLLDNDPKFRMSSYSAIAKSLRDRGLDNEAKKIFVAACYRDARTDEQDESHKRNRRKWQRRGVVRWLNRMWDREKWKPGSGRYRKHAKYIPIARLKRPARVLGPLLCISWCIGLVYAISFALAEPTNVVNGINFLVAIVATSVLRGTLRRFADRLYWSLLDYGTSATRLAVLILLLMLTSFVFVSGELRNIDPTIAAETLVVEKQKNLPASSAPVELTWDADKHPLRLNWGFGERLWTTLRYHIPMVSAVVADEWQPTDGPLHLAGLTGNLDKGETPLFWKKIIHAWNLWLGWWPLPLAEWPKARDWFGFMQWINWVLWPLFLPFLIRKLRRD